MTETRYARQKRKREAQARHESIAANLAYGFISTFDDALEKIQPPCQKAGLPSPWMDYDRFPENREDYETVMPTAKEAEALCADCEIAKMGDLCLKYALSTRQGHGVWQGKRFSDGKIIPDGINSPDMPNRERD